MMFWSSCVAVLVISHLAMIDSLRLALRSDVVCHPDLAASEFPQAI